MTPMLLSMMITLAAIAADALPDSLPDSLPDAGSPPHTSTTQQVQITAVVEPRAKGARQAPSSETWTAIGTPEPHVELCPTCPSGFRYSGYTVQWYRVVAADRWGNCLSDDSGREWWYVHDGSQWREQPAPPHAAQTHDPGAAGARRATFIRGR